VAGSGDRGRAIPRLRGDVSSAYDGTADAWAAGPARLYETLARVIVAAVGQLVRADAAVARGCALLAFVHVRPADGEKPMRYTNGRDESEGNSAARGEPSKASGRCDRTRNLLCQRAADA
jgi:hypothetical protein